MRLSQATGDPKPLDVKFGTAVLHIDYLPMNFTIAELEKMQAEKSVSTVVDQILRVVKQWDLTDEHDKLIPLEAGPMKEQVGMNVYSRILEAIREDSMPSDPASKSSAAG